MMLKALALVALLLPLAAPIPVQDKPALTEVEQLKLENLQLRTAAAQTLAALDSCRGQLGTVQDALGKYRALVSSQELTAAEAKLKADVEQAHPGYAWDPKTGAFTKKAPQPEAKQ